MAQGDVPIAGGDGLAREYEAALEHLRKPKRFSQGLLLIGTLALFLLVQNTNSARALLILVSVLLFHEAGHFAGRPNTHSPRPSSTRRFAAP